MNITLSSLTYGGDSIGRLPDGRAVFVPFALPCETVSIELIEEKRGHARARLLEILTPSPQRITPKCTHFSECGGCHYQLLSYADQLAAKTAILSEQLQRIGGLADPPVRPAIASLEPFNYRNHIQFHLSPEGKLGYYRAQTNTVLPIRECHLPEAPLNILWPQLDFEALPEIERVGLRMGVNEDFQLILESHDPQTPEFSVEDLTLSAVHLSPAGAIVLAGSEAVYMEVLGRAYRVSAGSFFQVNTRMAEAMVQHILETLPKYTSLSEQSTLIDCYCGVGLFSAFLAPQVGRLVGIEASPSACEDFVENLDEFDNVELYEAPVEMILPQLDVRPGIILLDPPRAGLDRHALEAVLTLAASLLVYVSCDPATLARDAKRLAAGGYHLEQITPFDLFPQTYHIESISFWTRNTARITPSTVPPVSNTYKT
jgi:23S rRNA (uracil1939-C5)-methyltransferase